MRIIQENEILLFNIVAIINPYQDMDEELIDPNAPIYDDQVLEDWYNFAGTIEGIIENFCDVVNISMSKNPNSLSEYIDFYAYDENGNKKNYLIDLRLSDHASTKNAKEIRKKHVKKINSNYRLEGVTVNNVIFDSYEDAIIYVRKILTKYFL